MAEQARPYTAYTMGAITAQRGGDVPVFNVMPTSAWYAQKLARRTPIWRRLFARTAAAEASSPVDPTGASHVIAAHEAGGDDTPAADATGD